MADSSSPLAQASPALQPTRAPMQNQTHTDIHPLTHIHTVRSTQSRSLHPSFGGFWQLFILLNWLSHYSWNTTRQGEKESCRSLKEGKKGTKSGKEKQEQREDEIRIC